MTSLIAASSSSPVHLSTCSPTHLLTRSPLASPLCSVHSDDPCRTLGVQASAVQVEGPRLGYLGTTASSRAKLGPEEENLLSAGLDLLSPKADPHEDQTSSGLQVLATPTKVMSQGGVRRFSSLEETLTNQNLAFSPASFLTATPTARDLISYSASGQEEEEPEGPETRIQSDPGDDEADEEASLQQCQQVANELRQAARRAVHLYRQLAAQGSERRVQRSAVLQGALDVVHCELQAVLRGGGTTAHLGDPGATAHLGDPGTTAHLGGPGASAHLGGPGTTAHLGGPGTTAHLGDPGASALLERYSELLVQMTRDKLNRVLNQDRV